VRWEKERERPPINLREVLQVDWVDAPLSQLALRYKRLRPTERTGNLGLGQSRLKADLPELSKHRLVASRVNRTHW
jgi:hypothetical protein